MRRTSERELGVSSAVRERTKAIATSQGGGGRGTTHKLDLAHLLAHRLVVVRHADVLLAARAVARRPDVGALGPGRERVAQEDGRAALVGRDVGLDLGALAHHGAVDDARRDDALFNVDDALAPLLLEPDRHLPLLVLPLGRLVLRGAALGLAAVAVRVL